MTLTAPTIKYMISECSKSILTEGNLTGATVKVYQNNSNLIGEGVANSSQLWISINDNVVLQQGDLITAIQTLGSNTSAHTPDPTEVQAIPEEPPAPIFRTKLFGCAKCLWLAGMVPGAKYSVLGQNETTFEYEERASGKTGSGSSHVPLNQSVWTGEKLKAQQDACGVLSSFSNSQPAEEYPQPTLPSPTVNKPLYECDTNIHGKGGVEGATFWMRRENNNTLLQESNRCTLGSPNFRASPEHLKKGEEIYFWQEFTVSQLDNKDRKEPKKDCPTRSNDSDRVKVLGAELIEPPHILEPLCAGGTMVTLTNLRPGARVRINHNGVVYIGQANSTGPQGFPVKPLQGNETVLAVMELCNGEKTDQSNIVNVDSQPADVPAPQIQDPLYACTDIIHVSNIHPGALVRVYSKSIGMIGQSYVYSDQTTITVAPGLMKEDVIYAVQGGCGMGSAKSNEVKVQSSDKLNPPTVIEPLYDCGDFVKVEDVIPGAMVEVYVNGNFAGDKMFSQDSGRIKINDLLKKNDKVKVRQRLCDLISEFSSEVTVQAFIGIWEEKEWYDTNGTPISEIDKILAVHATLLRTGKVLFFGGDQHTKDLSDSDNVDHSRLMDVNTFRIKKITGLINPPSNIFCAGHAQTRFGDLLVAGGTEAWRKEGELIDHAAHNHFIGSRDTWIFDAETEGWLRKSLLNTQRPEDFIAGHNAENVWLEEQADLNNPDALIHKTGGKWYPTIIALPDGKLLCVSGHPREEDSRHNNNSLEVFNLASGEWELVGDKDADLIPRIAGRNYEYPRLFILSNGTVFSAYRMKDGNVHKWTIGSDPDDWSQVAGPMGDRHIHSSLSGSAVLLPFWLVSKNIYSPDKILMVGGRKPQIIEPNSADAEWKATDTRKLTSGSNNQPPERYNVGAVILPTGEIFVEGGAQDSRDDNTGVLAAELYNPEKDEWTVLPEAGVVRNYHHVALLLPDGSIYVGGGNINSASGLINRRFEIEVFKPWYFCRSRPGLESVPESTNHGSSFSIMSPDSRRIAKAVVVKCGTTTHNFDSDQRLVELPIQPGEKNDELSVEVPNKKNLLISGYYLLFILDRENVPSLGKFIQIRPKSTCFIATEVYSEESFELQTLRDWRDNLSKSWHGRFFIQIYTLISPNLVIILRSIPTLKNLTRRILNLIVSILNRNYSKNTSS